MIVLGIGTNIGDRLANLRRAINALRHVDGLSVQQVSPVYTSDALLPDNAPPDWNLPYLNLAVRCDTTLQPLALLDVLKKIEASFGREAPVRHWGPRVIDIDILAWDEKIITSEKLTIPKVDLLLRPFALWPLADVAPTWVFPETGMHQGKTAEELVEKWGSRFSGDAPLHTKQIYQRADTSQLVGIINVTPDSFSDGNQFYTPETALRQALHLMSSGADIIDIGAESTSPSAHPITARVEWERLEPVLKLIQAEKKNFSIPPKISIDTRHAEVAEKALAFDIDWINDVTGLDDPAMRSIIAAAKVDCVVMHHIRIPEDRNYVLTRAEDPVKLIYEWGAKRLDELERAGIQREKVIFDPGIGFGKMAEQSLLVVKHIERFAELGTRLLVGPSRKTFLALFTQYGFSDRDIETLAVVLHLAKHNVDYMRVHNIEMCARGLRVMRAL
jgi:2-amino-4-hydroxy-6-hydroxymethyldihydropteridine diphosphokinase/dihydropteroate synthase